MANRIKINICGLDIPLVTKEKQSYMMDLASEVEILIKELVNTGGTVSTSAITAALSYLHDLKTSEKKVAKLNKKIASLEEEIEKLKEDKITVENGGVSIITSKTKNPMRPIDTLKKKGMTDFYQKD